MQPGTALALISCLSNRKCLNLLKIRTYRWRWAERQSSKRVQTGEPNLAKIPPCGLLTVFPCRRPWSCCAGTGDFRAASSCPRRTRLPFSIQTGFTRSQARAKSAAAIEPMTVAVKSYSTMTWPVPSIPEQGHHCSAASFQLQTSGIRVRSGLAETAG